MTNNKTPKHNYERIHEIVISLTKQRTTMFNSIINNPIFSEKQKEYLIKEKKEEWKTRTFANALFTWNEAHNCYIFTK